MDFNSKETGNHIIQPIAYNRIRKIRKRGARTRSAYDQYLIHCIAYDFVSDILKVPKAYEYDDNSYVMDQIPDAQFVPERYYGNFPELVVALVSFSQHMISNGYWPYKYSIFRINDYQFVLIDVSLFGSIDSKKVKFPKNPTIYSLEEASMYYGIHIYEEYEIISRPRKARHYDVFTELMYT
jgi:hypothetical protein